MSEMIWNHGKWSAYNTDKPSWVGCQIKCPKCEYWSAEGAWREGEALCEDCGSHNAIICPNCDGFFDHVYSGDMVFCVR